MAKDHLPTPNVYFTQASRQDADLVQHSFVEYKRAHPEQLEYLVPVIVADQVHQPRPVCERWLTPEELRSAKNLGPWGYAFDLSLDVSTEYLDSMVLGYRIGKTSRHEHIVRMSMFQRVFSEFPINGTWADLGTNSGVIPVLLSDSAAGQITGVDISQVNIDKANLLKALSGRMMQDTYGKRDKLSFVTADIYDFLRQSAAEQFNVISGLGIFYHMTDPLGLLSLMYLKAKDFIIVDTVCHNVAFSGWIQTVSRHVVDPTLAHANDTRKIIELHPTYRGMVDSLFQSGFRKIIEVVPSAEILSEFHGSIYDQMNRRMFIAFKEAPG